MISRVVRQSLEFLALQENFRGYRGVSGRGVHVLRINLAVSIDVALRDFSPDLRGIDVGIRLVQEYTGRYNSGADEHGEPELSSIHRFTFFLSVPTTCLKMTNGDALLHGREELFYEIR